MCLWKGRAYFIFKMTILMNMHTELYFISRSCGNCGPMPSGRESIGCKDMEKVVEVMGEAEVDCITGHEGFHGACPYN